MHSERRIIGFDPGLRRTGWGVISCVGQKSSFQGCGVITSDARATLAERLRQLFTAINGVLEAQDPHEACVEETFVNRDPQSALKLGHARATALLAPSLYGLPVFEYGANHIKKTVTGSGHAEKAQISSMVEILLPEAKGLLTPDSADALAVAICHAHHGDVLRRASK